MKTPNFDTVTEFEKKVAEFFGAPFGVATDSCTSALELCLRYKKAEKMWCPRRTYLSVPMLANKLNIKLMWIDYGDEDNEWVDYYRLIHNIFDAAVLWRKDSYLPNTLMCLSFQYQKHLSLGRGGMILCDNEEDAIQLRKMAYDGRIPGIPWRDQDVDTIGFHYYMTPDTAALGLNKLDQAIATLPRQWVHTDWPDISKFKVFNK